MRYQISHLTTYTYDRPVTLAPHTLRLRPRCDVTQTLHQFSLEIDPTPVQIVETVDLDGNALIRIWLPKTPIDRLTVLATSEVETFRSNPFDFLLEPWAVQLPLDYPLSLSDRLHPYLNGQSSRPLSGIDPIAAQLGQQIWTQTHGDVISFLGSLNQTIYSECQYLLREKGSPMPAGITWTKREGSCRDYAMLLIEVCRSVGLAARFVSGYQEGDLKKQDWHPHAWVEVYLPGAGWRGYDPTHGLAVADTHVALVACPTARGTTPIEGSLNQTGVRSDMGYELKIKKL